MCARQLTYPVLVGFFLAGVVTAQETVQSPDQHALFSTVFYPASAEDRTSVAFKPLHRWLAAAPEDEAREILAMLRAEITTTNSPDNVFSAGILLSRRPDLTSAAVVLDAIEIRAGVETRLDSAAMYVHKHVQARLWEALANMLCRLSPAERDVLADRVIDNASKVISSPGEWQLVSEGAASCLPCLGDAGFRLLDAIARDPDRRRRAGDALPWELSRTGDPRALETIVLLYDVGRRGRGCTGALHAMGTLTARLDKAGVPVPEASRAAAWLRIQQHLLDEDDQIQACAIEAGAMVVDVDQDAELFATVLAGLEQSSGRVRKAALCVLRRSAAALQPGVQHKAREFLSSDDGTIRAYAQEILAATEPPEGLVTMPTVEALLNDGLAKGGFTAAEAKAIRDAMEAAGDEMTVPAFEKVLEIVLTGKDR